MENLISDIRKLLCAKGYSSFNPLTLHSKITCSFPMILNGKVCVTIDAQYVYIKKGIPVVANGNHDEMTIEGMSPESIEKIACALMIENSIEDEQIRQ